LESCTILKLISFLSSHGLEVKTKGQKWKPFQSTLAFGRGRGNRGLNSRPHICNSGTLSLELLHQLNTLCFCVRDLDPELSQISESRFGCGWHSINRQQRWLMYLSTQSPRQKSDELVYMLIRFRGASFDTS
jgi:hypothetical protein